MMKKHGPGKCCCCGPCSTFTDSFIPTSPSGRDPLPAADYTEQVTAWSWVMSGSTKLQYIKPDNDGAFFTYNGSTKASQIIRPFWRQDNTGSMKIIHNWLDVDNHAYVLCEPTDTRYLDIEIHSVVEGSDSTIATDTFDSGTLRQHLVWTGYAKNYLQVIPRLAGNGIYLSGEVGDSGGSLCGIEAVGTGLQLDTFDWSGCIVASAMHGLARFAYRVDIIDPDGTTVVETYTLTISGTPGQTPTVYSRYYAAGTVFLSFDSVDKRVRVYFYEAYIVREYRRTLPCADLASLDDWELAHYSGTDSDTVCRITALM